jgi:hypothetical protein
MRRTRNQDKYIRFILRHPQLNNSQKIWLVYWFMDRSGYPRCLATTERELSMSSGNTNNRIVKDLIALKIIKRIGGVPLGTHRETPVFDFTPEFEAAVAAFSINPDGCFLNEGFTLPYEEGPLPCDPNNKETNQQESLQEFMDANEILEMPDQIKINGDIK